MKTAKSSLKQQNPKDSVNKTKSLIKKKLKIIVCKKCLHKQKVRSKTSICSICLWPINKEYKNKNKVLIRQNVKHPVDNIHQLLDEGTKGEENGRR